MNKKRLAELVQLGQIANLFSGLSGDQQRAQQAQMNIALQMLGLQQQAQANAARQQLAVQNQRLNERETGLRERQVGVGESLNANQLEFERAKHADDMMRLAAEQANRAADRGVDLANARELLDFRKQEATQRRDEFNRELEERKAARALQERIALAKSYETRDPDVASEVLGGRPLPEAVKYVHETRDVAPRRSALDMAVRAIYKGKPESIQQNLGAVEPRDTIGQEAWNSLDWDTLNGLLIGQPSSAPQAPQAPAPLPNVTFNPKAVNMNESLAPNVSDYWVPYSGPGGTRLSGHFDLPALLKDIFTGRKRGPAISPQEQEMQRRALEFSYGPQ